MQGSLVDIERLHTDHGEISHKASCQWEAVGAEADRRKVDGRLRDIRAKYLDKPEKTAQKLLLRSTVSSGAM